MPTVVEEGVQGDHRYVVADHDITSLTNANNEPLTPESDFTLDAVFGGEILQVEQPGSYVYQLDANDDLYVEGYGGTDPTAGTDVGTVRIKWLGSPAP